MANKEDRKADSKNPIAVRVHPINVGQGDAILLEVKYDKGSPKKWLIDGGRGQKSTFSNLITALGKNDCISGGEDRTYQQIKLESIVNTHPDKDHHLGINALLGTGNKEIKLGDRFTVCCPIITTEAASLYYYEQFFKCVLYEEKYSGAESDSPKFWFQPDAPGKKHYYEFKHLPQLPTVKVCKSSSFLKIEDFDWNASSILTTVKIPKSKYYYDVVLTGDSNGDVILNTLGLRLEKDMPCIRKTVRIFQVPHHGSKNNSSYEFYKQFDADIYFISHGALYNHPHSEVITGILSAAVEKGGRFCTIVVTATWFEESKINYFYRKRIRHWRDFVEIYYYNTGTPYVTLDWSKSLPEGLIKYTEREEKEQRKGTDNPLCSRCYKKCYRCAKNGLCKECLTCIICKEFTDETDKFTAVCNRCGSRAHANAETDCTRYTITPKNYYCIKCRKCTICSNDTKESTDLEVIKCNKCKACAHVNCVLVRNTRDKNSSASIHICCWCDLIIHHATQSMSLTTHDFEDGNCFFNSMAINIKNEADKLWQQHLETSLKTENSSISSYLRLVLVLELLGARRRLYEKFFPNNLDCVEEVKKFWKLDSSPIGNFMPYALAAALNCSIVIYFKDSNRDPLTIGPTEGYTIPTAYLTYSPDGSGRYDALDL